MNAARLAPEHGIGVAARLDVARAAVANLAEAMLHTTATSQHVRGRLHD